MATPVPTTIDWLKTDCPKSNPRKVKAAIKKASIMGFESTRVKFSTVSCNGLKSSSGIFLSIGLRVSTFAPIASRSTLPISLNQKLCPRTKAVINPDPSAATIPRRPSAAIAPIVGQKERQKPRVMARCIVRMLMGPRGSAAANPIVAEVKNRRKFGL